MFVLWPSKPPSYMVFVFFSCLDPKGISGKFSYCGPDIESCFDTLNHLVQSGWQLVNAKLTESAGKAIDLPIEAFDGCPIREHLGQLQGTWEMLLINPCGNSLPVKVGFVRAQNAEISIQRAMQRQERISQQREQTQSYIDSLYTKIDTIQARIQETKVEWGVV